MSIIDYNLLSFLQKWLCCQIYPKTRLKPYQNPNHLVILNFPMPLCSNLKILQPTCHLERSKRSADCNPQLQPSLRSMKQSKNPKNNQSKNIPLSGAGNKVDWGNTCQKIQLPTSYNPTVSKKQNLLRTLTIGLN